MSDIKKEEFKNFNVLVIGDSCTDKFTYGDTFRLAPEAPVPVFNPTYSTTNLGMAGNVVANLKALGIITSTLHNLENVVKNRYVDDRSGQILLRVDENDKVQRIKPEVLKLIVNNELYGLKLDAIVISDYDKGFLEEEDIELICKNNSNVFIDTKKIINEWVKYATFIKINHVEYERTEYTLKHLDIEDKLIITLSSKGCQHKGKIYPVKKVQIRDVSGAGDTFISAFVCSFLASESIEISIQAANIAATNVVKRRGVVAL